MFELPALAEAPKPARMVVKLQDCAMTQLACQQCMTTPPREGLSPGLGSKPPTRSKSSGTNSKWQGNPSSLWALPADGPAPRRPVGTPRCLRLKAQGPDYRQGRLKDGSGMAVYFLNHISTYIYIYIHINIKTYTYIYIFI